MHICFITIVRGHYFTMATYRVLFFCNFLIRCHKQEFPHESKHWTSLKLGCPGRPTSVHVLFRFPFSNTTVPGLLTKAAHSHWLKIKSHSWSKSKNKLAGILFSGLTLPLTSRHAYRTNSNRFYQYLYISFSLITRL